PICAVRERWPKERRSFTPYQRWLRRSSGRLRLEWSVMEKSFDKSSGCGTGRVVSEKSSGAQQVGHAAALAQRAQALLERGGNGNAVAQAAVAFGGLGVASHQHRPGRIDRRRVVQRVDHVIDLCLERTRIAERIRI